MILLPTHIAIDYSFARPAPAFIAGADVRLVCRYISPIRGNKKNLTIAERDALHDAGLSILLVWENGQLDPLQGAPKGQLHGKDARKYARELGYPDDLPIIAAVDFDVQPAQMGVVLAYLQAFHAEAEPIGAYGKDTVITAAHDLAGSTLGWQTVAWSHGRRSPWADVLQHATPVHPTVPPLGAVDDNTVLRTFKAWSALPDPVPPPPNPQPEDDTLDIRLLTFADSDAQFLAEATAAGRVLNCRWVGTAKLSAARDVHKAAAAADHRPFEYPFEIPWLANVALFGPIPSGDSKHSWTGQEFAALDQGGTVDLEARELAQHANEEALHANEAVTRIGSTISDIRMGGQRIADAGGH